MLGLIAKRIKSCKKCSLWKTRTNTVPGEGPVNARLMFIGQAPGKSEDLTGRPFIGRSGKLLTTMLTEAGLDRKKLFITSVLKCYPPANRTPTKTEIVKCLPYTIEQIKEIKPDIICLLGNVAVKTFLGRSNLTDLHGKLVVKNNNQYFITFHPAAALRFPKIKSLMIKDLSKLKQLILS